MTFKKRIGSWNRKNINSEEVIKDYLSGLTLREIGLKYNCNYGVIKKRLIENNISIRSCSESRTISLNKGKFRIWNKDMPLSIDHKTKLKEQHRTNPIMGMRGKKHSYKTIEKMKLARAKQKIGPTSNKTKRLLSRIAKEKGYGLWMTGKKLSEEHKAKIKEHVPRGKKCHLWKGGISYELYSPEWTKGFKNQIRKRDNQICMNCGIHREKLKYALSVHHINYDKQCTLNQNCISLCRVCHGLTQFNREYWQKLFQEKLSKLYGYKYTEKGESIIEINSGETKC